MAPRPTGLRWLIAASVVAVAAVAFAVVAFLSLSAARDERDAAAADLAALETELAGAQEARERAIADRTAAERELRDAEARVTRAGAALTDAEQRESELEARRQEAEAAEPGLLAAAGEYPDAAAAAIGAVEAHLDTASEMAELRSLQAEAAAEGSYRTYNTLQGRYNALVDAFNGQGDAVAAAVDALPSFRYRGVASSEPPPAAAHATVNETVLDPPTGPARIEGTFPESIPCTRRGDGCRWYWEITFTETNALWVTIDRLGIRYTDRRGTTWVSQSGEWRSVTIGVPPLGSARWDSWVQSLDPDSEGNLQGATLQVRWEGTDAEGNAISGRARVTLEWRIDD